MTTIKLKKNIAAAPRKQGRGPLRPTGVKRTHQTLAQAQAQAEAQAERDQRRKRWDERTPPGEGRPPRTDDRGPREGEQRPRFADRHRDDRRPPPHGAAGPRRFGPQVSGPQGSGPYGSGPHGSGPNRSGPRDERAPNPAWSNQRPVGRGPQGPGPRGPQNQRPAPFSPDRPFGPRPQADQRSGPGPRTRDDRPARAYGDRPQSYADRQTGPRRDGHLAPQGERRPFQPGDRPRPPARSDERRPYPQVDRPANRSNAMPARPPAAEGAAPELPRLSKRMSELGLASRREADDWISRGLVRVDGVIVDQLGTRVAPNQQITIDPEAHNEQSKLVTILLHKPLGIVSGQAEDGHAPAATLIKADSRWPGDHQPRKFHPSQLHHLVPAGRLDLDSTGLLVLTQDGRVAKMLIGADTKVEKEYVVEVAWTEQPDAANLKDSFPADKLELLRNGLELDRQPLKPAKVSWQNETHLRFVLREGKRRQIRRMCEAVGLQVVSLKRIRIGRVGLGDMAPGQWRYLGPFETFL